MAFYATPAHDRSANPFPTIKHIYIDTRIQSIKLNNIETHEGTVAPWLKYLCSSALNRMDYTSTSSLRLSITSPILTSPPSFPSLESHHAVDILRTSLNVPFGSPSRTLPPHLGLFLVAFSHRCVEEYIHPWHVNNKHLMGCWWLEEERDGLCFAFFHMLPHSVGWCSLIERDWNAAKRDKGIRRNKYARKDWWFGLMDGWQGRWRIECLNVIVESGKCHRKMDEGRGSGRMGVAPVSVIAMLSATFSLSLLPFTSFLSLL